MASNLPELIGTNGFLTEIFRNVSGTNRYVHWNPINKVKKAATIRPAKTHLKNICTGSAHNIHSATVQIYNGNEQRDL